MAKFHFYKKEQETITLEQLLNLWMQNNTIRLKGSTIAKYQSMIDSHILPSLGQVSVRDLTATKVNTFLIDKLKSGRKDGNGGLSASYVQSMSIILNAALRFGVAEELCMPLKTPIYKPSFSKKELRILSPYEQKRLELYLTNNITPTKLGILLSLYTGMRLGEICALTWEDIDFTENIIRVRHTIARVKSQNSTSKCMTALIVDSPKTSSSRRDIPIPSRLRSYLWLIKCQMNSTYVVSASDTFLSPRTLEYRFHKILERCEIYSVNYHALRHTFATRCIELEVDVKSLSEILGHANVNITLNTYVHSSMELKRKQLEKVNRWMEA